MTKEKAPVSLDEVIASKKPEELIKDINFEDGVELLELLCEKIENGELSLENSVLSFERGLMVINKLQEHLNKAEERIKILRK